MFYKVWIRKIMYFYTFFDLKKSVPLNLYEWNEQFHWVKCYFNVMNTLKCILTQSHIHHPAVPNAYKNERINRSLKNSKKKYTI